MVSRESQILSGGSRQLKSCFLGFIEFIEIYLLDFVQAAGKNNVGQEHLRNSNSCVTAHWRAFNVSEINHPHCLMCCLVLVLITTCRSNYVIIKTTVHKNRGMGNAPRKQSAIFSHCTVA